LVDPCPLSRWAGAYSSAPSARGEIASRAASYGREVEPSAA